MRYRAICLFVALLIAAPDPSAFASSDELQPALSAGESRLFVGVAAGSQLSAFIDSSFRIRVLGGNYYGELGVNAGPNLKVTTPVLVVDLRQPTAALAAGYFHLLALTENGVAYAWGNNQYGQAGDRPWVGTSTSNPGPFDVATDVTAIAAGGNHSLLLGKDGRVRTIGLNVSGQLGRSDNLGTTLPNPVVTIVNGLDDVVAIAGGASHSVALRRDGTVWTFGDNTYGQLGRDIPGINTPTPGQVTGLTDVVAISAGFWHNLALRRDGTVWSWGRNWFGQLGRSTSMLTDAPNPVPQQVIGVAGVKQVAAGASHSVILRTDGRIMSWGSNNVGQLGTVTDAGSNIAYPAPREVPAPFPAVAVTTGASHSVAVQADGSLWSWGWNLGGQIGAPPTDTLTPNPTPVKIQGTAQVQAPRSRLLPDSITRVATAAPAGSAALVNLTMTSGARAGYITADRCSALTTGPQSKSNGNYPRDQSIANLSVVPVDADGLLCIYNEQQVHLIADLQGVFSASGSLRFDPVPPARLLDTRAATPNSLFSITRVQTPYAGAVAALINLTMVGGPLFSGYVTVDKCSALTPGPQTKSNGNFNKNLTIANLGVVALDPDGSFCVLSDLPVDRIVDIQGVFSPAAQTRLTALPPARVLDTRGVGPAGADTLTRVQTGQAGAASVLVNLTMTGATDTGYITADKCSALTIGEQTKSNGNFQGGRDVANLSVVPVDSDGSFCIYTNAATHLIVDLQGTFSGSGALGLDIVGPTRLLDTRLS